MSSAESDGIFGVKSEDAGRLLETLDRVGHETRTARRGYWFPLVLFGLIILGTLFFLRPPSGPFACPPGQLHGDVCGDLTPNRFHLLLGMFGGGMNASHPWGLGLFWLTAIPLGFVATVLFYRAQGRRRGVEGRVWPYVVAGIAPFVVAILTNPTVATWMHMPRWVWWWRIHTENFEFRGLLPIFLITLGFFVLARLERSWVLGGIAAAFFGLAVLANTYNISNALYRIHHWVTPDWAVNPSFAGGFLVFVGIIAFLLGRKRLEPSS